MRLSNTITTITGGGSDGWDLFIKARKMISEGHDITELTIGEHDIKTDTRILEAMHTAALGGATGYAMVPGIDDLRNAVATRLAARTGVPTTLDNVLITAGGQAALFAAFRAALDEGDTALYINPYYATYPGTIRSVGGVPKAVTAEADNGFLPTFEALDAAAAGAKALLINSPNNPTGAVYGRDTLEAIAAVAIKHDLIVISDEVYDTQVWEGEHISIRSLEGMNERTFVVGSMSKSHAMTGSRVGWLVGPDEAMSHVLNLLTNTNYGVAGFTQRAALFALGLGEAFEDEIGAPFQRRRALAQKALEGQNAIRLSQPSGAMYLMLDIRATGLSGDDFADKLLMERHIAVMPGESFGDAAAGHVRIAMTIPDAPFEAAIKEIAAFAANLA
ncbi:MULTISPECIES: pyridoxal phosphate-dependent aminotransferase [Lentibacter]|jgi:arginine:pyruvate transaminase|uniref:Aminotransferase n=1 Tax=Lentibacter algarum TaxID=576131 RepID=A0A1H3KG37_9RHOB|nr:pyridoxal phosphate-dependent aminotransferase [Lentibacter algarum]WIF31956.1 putative aspartate aminotransferase [Lentibacter algarum]SDY51152.1 arginine:pyruvate transaminase [Lentibacter algarum]